VLEEFVHFPLIKELILFYQWLIFLSSYLLPNDFVIFINSVVQVAKEALIIVERLVVAHKIAELVHGVVIVVTEILVPSGSFLLAMMQMAVDEAERGLLKVEVYGY